MSCSWKLLKRRFYIKDCAISITYSNVSSIVPLPSPMSPSTLSTLPPFVSFLIFFYFALCCKKQWQAIVHHRFLLCVAKMVLICHTFMLTLNLLNFFVGFFNRFNPKPNSCTLKGSSSSFNARWAWRWNKRKQMGICKLKKVLQGECMH